MRLVFINDWIHELHVAVVKQQVACCSGTKNSRLILKAKESYIECGVINST